MYLMREAGWTVDCVAARHGGTQQITLPTNEKGQTKYDANCYKMFVSCRYPTLEEIKTLSIKHSLVLQLVLHHFLVHRVPNGS